MFGSSTAGDATVSLGRTFSYDLCGQVPDIVLIESMMFYAVYPSCMLSTR